MITNVSLEPVMLNSVLRWNITAPTNLIQNNVSFINGYKHRYNEIFEAISGKLNVAGIHASGDNTPGLENPD
jgi:hypothetical protein